MNWAEFFHNNNDFRTWDAEHFTWLAIGSVWCAGWIWHGRRLATDAEKTRAGLTMSLVPVVFWFISMGIMAGLGQTTAGQILPLHLCYALNFVMPFMLWRRSELVFDIVYFWVMAACLQALFTPDLRTAWPGWFSVKYWPVHIGLVSAVLYATVVYGFRPSYKGIYWALLFGNLFVAVLHPINLMLHTNFMYTEKPPPGTVLELLGEHYLLAAEPIALLFFHIVYLPILFLKKREKAGV